MFFLIAVLCIFIILGTIKYPFEEDGTIQYKHLYKSKHFPELLLTEVFLIVIINAILFKEIDNYLGIVIVLAFSYVLIRVINQRLIKKGSENSWNFSCRKQK